MRDTKKLSTFAEKNHSAQQNGSCGSIECEGRASFRAFLFSLTVLKVCGNSAVFPSVCNRGSLREHAFLVFAFWSNVFNISKFSHLCYMLLKLKQTCMVKIETLIYKNK